MVSARAQLSDGQSHSLCSSRARTVARSPRHAGPQDGAQRRDASIEAERTRRAVLERADRVSTHSRRGRKQTLFLWAGVACDQAWIYAVHMAKARQTAFAKAPDASARMAGRRRALRIAHARAWRAACRFT